LKIARNVPFVDQTWLVDCCIGMDTLKPCFVYLNARLIEKLKNSNRKQPQPLNIYNETELFIAHLTSALFGRLLWLGSGLLLLNFLSNRLNNDLLLLGPLALRCCFRNSLLGNGGSLECDI
jgi:hypothetical protein